MTKHLEDFIIFGAPDIRQDEIEEVVDSLESGWLGTGPKVATFEKMFADYKGVDKSRVAAVNSCTAALHLSLLAAGVGPGDEVITTAMTFCATVNAIIHCGATPVLVDVDPMSMNIDPKGIEASITSKTRAILLVHFAGRPCNMKRILEIADRHNLKIIEDCAHAVEAEYFGMKCGTMGDFGCFSFYVTKNLATGEGGMVIAKNEEDIFKIKRLALHGLSKDAWHRFSDNGYKHYHVVDLGFKYNMMDIQAAIGIHQLNRIEKNWLRRKEIWDRYQEAFSNLPVSCPAEPEPSSRHALHLFTLLLDKNYSGIERDEFLEEMTKRKIGVGVHYLSIPEHPYYRKRFGWRPEDFPISYQIGRATVSIPLSPKLTDRDVERVIENVREVIGEKN